MALFEGTTTTVGATTSPLLIYPMAEDVNIYCDIIIVGIDNLTNCAQFDRIMRVKRANGATPVIFDNPKNNEYRESGASGWSYAIVPVVDGFEIRVTGAAGKTINWFAEVHSRQIVF